MEELLINPNNSKEQKYIDLIPQIKNLLSKESDKLANQANFIAAIKQTFDFLWVGFYHIQDDELVLGTFQGPVACTRIKKGKGVCGQSWQIEKSIIVPNVNEWPDHIACSHLSQSEIVLPVFKNESIVAVLDIDSIYLNQFDNIDERYLNILLKLVEF